MRERMGLCAGPMRFFSDNAAPAHPKVLEAIAAANRLDTAYDGDRWSKRLDAAFSALFEREVEALWVSTGTAANSLALAALCPPHGSIVCHRDAPRFQHASLNDIGTEASASRVEVMITGSVITATVHEAASNDAPMCAA